MRDVLQLAGGLDVFYSQGSMDGKVLAEWERYHRAERIAWMQAVARLQTLDASMKYFL
jgi:hypothetical protein